MTLHSSDSLPFIVSLSDHIPGLQLHCWVQELWDWLEGVYLFRGLAILWTPGSGGSGYVIWCSGIQMNRDEQKSFSSQVGRLSIMEPEIASLPSNFWKEVKTGSWAQPNEPNGHFTSLMLVVLASTSLFFEKESNAKYRTSPRPAHNTLWSMSYLRTARFG